MKTEILSIEDPTAINKALKILHEGGLVAFPTDTVYGLGSTAFNQTAIEEIFVVKERPPEKSIPILISDIGKLHSIAKEVTPLAYRFARRFWPGPLTLILLKQNDLPEAVSSTTTIGVRVPDHYFAREILRSAGPMAVTSANLSNFESPRTAQMVFNYLGGRIPLILEGGQTPGGIPSTVVDVTGEYPILLREGPLTIEELKSII